MKTMSPCFCRVATFAVGVGLFLMSFAVCNAQVSAARTAPPLVEDFNQVQRRLPAGWNVVAGDWQVENGSLVVHSLKSDSYITFGEEAWQNYEIEASLTFREVRNESRWLALLFRTSKDGAAPWSQVPVRFDPTLLNGVEFAVRTPQKKWSVRSKNPAPMKSELNQKRHLKAIVRGPRVDAYLDGKHILSSQYCVDRSHGCVGLGVSGCVAAFDDVVVRRLPNTPVSPKVALRSCDVVAHRGFSSAAPENTLAAIRAAIQAGATGCEFDVYRSADGTIVLMHDKTVNRTTDGVGPVTELTLQQLQELDAGSWKGKQFAGERVPTLKEALRLLDQSGCQPVIEIKMEGISKQVVEDVRELGMVDQVAVIAFSEAVVREIRELEPRIDCAWLYGKTPEGTPVQQAEWLASRAIKCQAKILDLNFTMLSPELITELKKRDLEVWTWTVNETPVMHALQRWGVDSITTDRPDVLGQPNGRIKRAK